MEYFTSHRIVLNIGYTLPGPDGEDRCEACFERKLLLSTQSHMQARESPSPDADGKPWSRLPLKRAPAAGRQSPSGAAPPALPRRRGRGGAASPLTYTLNGTAAAAAAAAPTESGGGGLGVSAKMAAPARAGECA